MDEFGDNVATLAELKSLPMIPLTSGRVTSAGSDTIFFPVASSVEKRGCSLRLLTLLLVDVFGCSSDYMIQYDVINYIFMCPEADE